MKVPGMPMLPTPAEMVDDTADYAAHEAVKQTPAYQKLHQEAKAQLLGGMQQPANPGALGMGPTIKMAMGDKGMRKKKK